MGRAVSGRVVDSGVQRILGVNRDPDRHFVGRTTSGDATIIAKLPSPDYALMPQLESLSMTLAGLAGVTSASLSW